MYIRISDDQEGETVDFSTRVSTFLDATFRGMKYNVLHVK
jgi:hypothetical protein